MKFKNLAVVVFAILTIFFFPKTCKMDLLKELKGIAEMEVIATAYYKPLKRQLVYLKNSYRDEVFLNGSGVTYSGEKATKGIIAADLRIFPLNTIVYIPEYGYGVVKDTGGKIRGRRIDVFVGEGEDGLKKAIKWGRKRLKIRVLKWGGF